MKNAAAIAVVLVALAAAAVGAKGFWEGPGRTAGWTWDESVVASSSVSTLNILPSADEAADGGAWGSLVDTNITW